MRTRHAQDSWSDLLKFIQGLHAAFDEEQAPSIAVVVAGIGACAPAPTVESVAVKCQLPEKAVSRMLRALVARNWIILEKRDGVMQIVVTIKGDAYMRTAIDALHGLVERIRLNASRADDDGAPINSREL
jgi:hypothetical protein